MTFYTVALQLVSRNCTTKHSCRSTSEIARTLHTNRDDPPPPKKKQIWERYRLDLHWDYVSYASRWYWILLCALTCCPLGCAVCIILIFGPLTASARRPSLPVAPDGPTDGRSDVLLVRWLRLHPARHASIHHLTIQFSQFLFNLPVNDRPVAASHKTVKLWSLRRRLMRSCQGWAQYWC